MRKTRRITAALALGTLGIALSGVAQASAETPLHLKSSFSGSEQPQGCDFREGLSYSLTSNSTVFGPQDNPDRVISQVELFVRHTNLDTGYELTEVDHYVTNYDSATGLSRTVGLSWNLHDAAGNLVYRGAGQAVFDTLTGVHVSTTPNLSVDFFGTLCPLLGGHALT
jgi:hypothetical protein